MRTGTQGAPPPRRTGRATVAEGLPVDTLVTATAPDEELLETTRLEKRPVDAGRRDVKYDSVCTTLGRAAEEKEKERP